MEKRPVFENNRFDELVKSPKAPFPVIPAPYQVRGELQSGSSIFKYL